MKKDILLPAEWHRQSAIQLTWPHENSDWEYMLAEVTTCFVLLARAIVSRQNLIVVCADAEQVASLIGEVSSPYTLTLIEAPSNDTWARDHAGISVFMNGEKVVYDFTFNGWGLKFASDKDNQINRRLATRKVFAENVTLVNCKQFVLEGGGIESDGKGTLLTTAECLLSANRNSHLSKKEIENHLKDIFGLQRVLWLHHGYLAGDDTDSHIDTLARFCDENTIAYVKCEDAEDEHFEALQKMEAELKLFTRADGTPYRLIPLPMAEPVFADGERLPATYANFLIMNTAVLVPTYDSPLDEVAISQLQQAFPDREIVGINCLALIKQHGSLHCVTMQYPEGFIR